MIDSEERATQKIARILSRLEPETAARVAAAMAEEFALDNAEAEAEATAVRDDDNRPSFLKTMHRIEVGKELLKKERAGKS